MLLLCNIHILIEQSKTFLQRSDLCFSFICCCHSEHPKRNIIFPLPVGIMASYLYYLLPAVGGYALTSLYFLKNPHILHRRKQTAFYCTHISHRGGTVSNLSQ